MTVSTTSARAAYSGDGTTQVFAVPFYFFADADLAVYVTLLGVTTRQTLTTHYTVTGAGDEAGGSITMLVAPISTSTLTIIREPQQVQETDYQANDPFPAETHEAALDRQVMISQHLQDQINRSLKVDVSSSAVTFPPPEANRYLGWNDLGTELENKVGSEGDADLPALGPSTAGRFLAVNSDGDGYTLVNKGELPAEIFGFGLGGDDTTALEDALDYMVANGGILALPKGTFTLTRDISVTGAGNGFTVRGAGAGLTQLKRGATGAAVFLNFVDCNDLTIRDLKINAQRSVVGDGSHALRIARGQNVTVERVYVTDWTSTGIIYFDPDSTTLTYKNVRIRDCVLDAYDGGGASNGISLSNTRDGRIENCNVLDLGRTGTPNFALQLKNANTRGRIVNCYARSGSGGICIGSVESGPPSNTYCRAENNILEDFTRAVRITLSEYCEVNNVHIDMAADNTLEYGVYLQAADYCTVSGVTLRRFEGTHAVYIGTSTGAYVELEHFYNTPYTANVVNFQTDAVRCKVKIVNYIGTRPTYTDDLATYTATGENMFQLGDGAQSKGVTIASGVITVRNPLVKALVIDTESSGATDDLDTITGNWKHGDLIMVSQANNGRDPTLKHGTGNIYFSGSADVTLNEAQETILLMRSDTVDGFVRANNGS